jgi:DNA mismatch repair protein MutS2
MEYDMSQGSPTYELILGVPGQSLALKAAKRAGVKDSIIEKAYEYLAPSVKQFHENLEEIEEIKKQLSDQIKSIKEEKSKLHSQNLSLSKKLQEFEKIRSQTLETEVNKLQSEVSDLIKHAKVENTFEKHEKLQEIKYDIPKMVKFQNKNNDVSEIDSAEEFAKSFPPGSKVFISSLSRDGVIQGTPNAKGEIPILSHSMRLVLNWRELTAPMSFDNPTKHSLSRQNYFNHSPQAATTVIDLRGFMVEKAIETLEVEFDKAILREDSRIKLIHGHGTDSLKKSIRKYLSRSLYVAQWKAGTQINGGDAVTWVDLNA